MRRIDFRSFSSGIALVFIVAVFILLPLHHHNHEDSAFHGDCAACIVSVDFVGVRP